MLSPTDAQSIDMHANERSSFIEVSLSRIQGACLKQNEVAGRPLRNGDAYCLYLASKGFSRCAAIL